MDLAARYGGEEFAVILDPASLDEAYEIAVCLAGAVRELAIPHAGCSKGKVTVCI